MRKLLIKLFNKIFRPKNMFIEFFYQQSSVYVDALGFSWDGWNKMKIEFETGGNPPKITIENTKSEKKAEYVIKNE